MPKSTANDISARASLLLVIAAMLLASACGGGEGGSGIVLNRAPSTSSAPDSQSGADSLEQPITPPISTPPEKTSSSTEDETPAEDESPAENDDPPETAPPTAPESPTETEEPEEIEPPEETEFDLQDAFGIDGVQLNLLPIPVAQASDEIEFEPDDIVKVPGRLELVKELENCLDASGASCTKADNWLYLGEYFSKHRTSVSLAIQAGAGDVTRGYSPAAINDVYAENENFINQAIKDGTIPHGSWINWSAYSSFGGDSKHAETYDFDVPLLIANSIVVAIATTNEGSGTPYGPFDPGPRGYYWLNEAVRNTVAIFVYGLNDDADDIHSGSTRCGSRVFRVCIGMPYQLSYKNKGIDIRGTSYSTGLLSGTAWAMKSLWPHLSSQQIAAIMLTTARPLRGGVNKYTGVGALDFTKLFEPVGPMTAKVLGSDDLVLERGFLHLPGLTDFDNPQGVDRFARSFQLATSTLSIQPGFADFDLDRFTPAAPGSRLQLAVNKNAGGAEDAALAFGHTNKLVLSSRYIGLCRDGQNTDLCLTTTRREDFFGGQGSGSFRLEDTTYTSLAATHRLPIRDWLELGFSAALTDARTSGRHLVGEVKGRLLQAEFSLRSNKDTRSRKSSTSMSIWASRFDGSMGLLGKQSPLHDRSAGVRLRWRLDF